MKADKIKWCPQHGYPLPCDKCGMPLSQPQQKEVYEAGKKIGREEAGEEFNKWFREQSWDVNRGAYIIPKIVLDRKLLMLKNPFRPSSRDGT